jgi:hypothetical protein
MTLPTKIILGKKMRSSAIFCAAATLLVSSAAPAHAYYNFGYGLGNWLWPVRALVYPLAATPWSYRSPAYLASTTIQAAARSSYRVIPQKNIYGTSLNYTEDQVQTQTPGLLKVPQGPADQINYARWVKPTDQADRELLARAPGAPALPVVYEDGTLAETGVPQPNTTQALRPLGVPFAYGNQPSYATNGTVEPLPAPPLKKLKKSKSQKQSDPALYQQPQAVVMPLNSGQPNQAIPQHLSSPLAAHFIETVNSRFDGDIGKALKHSETRNLAEAMGLVDRKGFSVGSLGQHRIETIAHIFKDQSLDPASKLEAMKILLRSVSGPATAQTEERSF